MVFFIILAFAGMVAAKSIIVIPAGHVAIVERLGKYFRSLPPGLHVLVPFTDRIAFRHRTDPQREELSAVSITHDNRPVRIVAALHFQVLDPVKASYATASYLEFLRELTRTTLHRRVATYTWESLRENTKALGAGVQEDLQKPAEDVGIRILSYEVFGVTPEA
jgi:regulator of protease activity HflC (stomatin/prohibitin superfamily)